LLLYVQVARTLRQLWGKLMAQRRVGLWLIGAFGGVGSSVALGLSALKLNLIATTGQVTALPEFAGVDLDSSDHFTLGGSEIRRDDFASAAGAVGGNTPAYSTALIESCRDDLDAWSANVCVATAKEFSIATFQSQLRDFVRTHQLDQLVVVNVASTEPPAELQPEHSELETLQKAAGSKNMSALPTSGWCAYAAIDAGFPFVNFTPSLGVAAPALLELAMTKRVPVAGSDGKTGETLVKSVLAPMFGARNLKVLSWVGHNILGNRDGQVLSDPAIRKSKLRSKDHVVADILGYQPQSLTTIECVNSLDDWKTAWDHVHFQGFLGVRMNLQFTWQGCDSALAAPLVIDLARLMLLAQRRGESGPMTHLAAFFKTPLGAIEHDLSRQMAMLREYARAASK
jgi:myo-inositol-1-phosphate synthase